MKKLLLTFILLYPFVNADELTWVDEKIAAIKPARVGLSDDLISHLSNPFNTQEEKDKLKLATKEPLKSKVILKPKKKYHHRSKNSKLVLDGLLNSTALISGKWYKLGEKVGLYKLSYVGNDYVVLSNKYRKKTLSIKSAKKKLNFKNN